MRDQGLAKAIEAAGGISELARRVGISQPSLSNWTRVPSERVIVVEEATGVSREILRPDLYAPKKTREIDPLDTARAQEYALLAQLLSRAPDTSILNRIAGLRGDASPLGLQHIGLAEAAAAINADTASQEFFDLFIGLGRGELLPYASYYLTGFLHERPLARLRDDLTRLGVARAEGNCEPEDHAAILCEIMAGLIRGEFDAEPGSDRLLFEKHLSPWIGRFWRDLEQAQTANFYRRVGSLGRVFMEIETEAFALAA